MANWLHMGGSSLTLGLALISPLVLLFEPSLGPALGATAGAWIFVSRLFLSRFEGEYQLQGAVAQERFDCAVLGLGWNDSLVASIADEDISSARRRAKGGEEARDWYPADLEVPWPASVLICQRSNAVWARRQHNTYSRAVAFAATGWFIIGVLLSIGSAATLAEYLVTIGLPSLPAFLDTTDLTRNHRTASRARQLLERQIDSLLATGDATRDNLRDFQDRLFTLRRDAPPVPRWFYNLVRSNYEADMRYAAQRAVGSATEQKGPSEEGR